MATHAVILSRAPGSTESRLSRVLEFFGVRVAVVDVQQLSALPAGDDRDARYVIFAPVDAFAAASEVPAAARAIERARAVYIYLSPDRAASDHALPRIEGLSSASLRAAGNRCAFSVSTDLGVLDGPMAGLTVSARPQPEDFTLASRDGDELRAGTSLMTADRAPAFVRFDWRGVPLFLCTSAAVVDIDQPLTSAFFDVKEYFGSLVPLVMFVRWAFEDSMWRPLEHGACLIVDDPLLKPTYGFCDFKSLLALMNRYDFTTNVAFIPWNWRRTSKTSSEFFRREDRRFSVSIHGCDHTASEFAETSIDLLDGKARLAQSRMQGHASRTGIAHDAIMVFPQGVFSSPTPGVLKRTGFIAAVNTDVNPVDSPSERTLVRDVWDVAIRRYGTFPIFTRRYDFHGVENFAFDVLIGKPCLVVSHHQFFKNDCAEVIDLVRKLNALRGGLTWRSLGGVIRRAGRRRASGPGRDEVEMYGNELLVSNSSDQPLNIVVRKMESDVALVAGVRGDRGNLDWARSGDGIVITDTVAPGNEAHIRVDYRDQPPACKPSRPVKYVASVAARRILCEFRDEYWQKFVR